MSLAPIPSLFRCDSCGRSRLLDQTMTLRLPYPVVEGAHRVLMVCADSAACETAAIVSCDPDFLDVEAEPEAANVIVFPGLLDHYAL